MKMSKILLHSDISNNEKTSKNVRADKLLKYFLVVFMLSWMFLLSSCVLFIPIGHERHGGHGEYHGHNEHREHEEHHD